MEHMKNAITLALFMRSMLTDLLTRTKWKTPLSLTFQSTRERMLLAFVSYCKPTYFVNICTKPSRNYSSPKQMENCLRSKSALLIHRLFLPNLLRNVSRISGKVSHQKRRSKLSDAHWFRTESKCSKIRKHNNAILLQECFFLYHLGPITSNFIAFLLVFQYLHYHLFL